MNCTCTMKHSANGYSRMRPFHCCSRTLSLAPAAAPLSLAILRPRYFRAVSGNSESVAFSVVVDAPFRIKLEPRNQATRARFVMQYPNNDLQEGRKPSSVRRRLFQDDDDDNDTESGRNSGIHDNIANCFFEEARTNRENAKERWNFDFEKEEPLPGRYVWVKLDQHGNEIRNPLESSNGVENLQTMQEEEDTQDDDITMQSHSEDKDDEKMTES